jgi:uncharacterized protein YndB with AHSA1/START domain
MSKASVTVNRTIDAAAERVWEAATDLRAMPDRIAAITNVEVLEGGNPFGVGTRWRETRVMMRREETEEMLVTAVEPGRSYTVEADNHGVHYTSIFRFEHAGSHRTNATMTFMGEPTGAQTVVQRLLGRLGLRVVRKSLERDLADLATAAEAEGEPVNPT